VKKALIAIDNLRIGGFQRLALDQAYSLSDEGYSVTLISFTDFNEVGIKSFVSLERQIIEAKKIDILVLSGTRIKQLHGLRALLIKHHPEDFIVVSHSLRASVMLYFLFFRSKNSFVTCIHQLPSLSAPVQRYKRFIYTQFSPLLTGYSEAVIQDWNYHRNQLPRIMRFFIRNKIHLLRNGVYLGRLPEMFSELGDSEKVFKPRLVFLGRTISWKGLDRFLNLVTDPKLSDFDVLLMVPELDMTTHEILQSKLGKRLELVAGKTIADFVPHKGDVHIYPTSYGQGVIYNESISLNCLEMACIGVPSVVTENGLATWPEQDIRKLFYDVNWGAEIECVDRIISASKLELSSDEIKRVRSLISIQNQTRKLKHLLRLDEAI
jgi:glycosyltransferase involved in cell wall biosynthesis